MQFIKWKTVSLNWIQNERLFNLATWHAGMLVSDHLFIVATETILMDRWKTLSWS